MQKYSLQLLRLLLDKKPIGLSDDVQKKAEERYWALLSGSPGEKDVENLMIAYGRAAWAYRQAEEDFKTSFGVEKEKEFFLFFLPEDLKKKWGEFVSSGGDIHNFRKGEEFEDFFSPEENIVFEEAFVETEYLVNEYLRKLSEGDEKDAYTNYVEKYKVEQKEIEKKLDELHSLIPEEGEKWDEEIAQEISFFQRGIADIEERPTVEKIQGKIDWYRGQMDLGNK